MAVTLILTNILTENKSTFDLCCDQGNPGHTSFLRVVKQYTKFDDPSFTICCVLDHKPKFAIRPL